MKCSGCSYDAKKTERTDGRCPKCGRAFVFDVNRGDPVSDYTFARVLERVSSGGRVRFLPQHAYYELRRRRHGSTRRRLFWLRIACGIAVATWLFLALRDARPTWTGLAFIIQAALVSMVFFTQRRLTHDLSLSDFEGCFRRWVAAHGDPPGLIRAPRTRDTSARVPEELLDYSFDRAVICDRSNTVDVLLANRFHFENNCAVLGVDGYPQHAFETVRTMLRKNPRLLVLALHDADAEGCKLAYRLHNDRSWFAGGVRVVDVGLRPQHARAFEAFCEPSSEFVTPGPSITKDEAQWLSKNRLELAVIPPEQLIKRLYRAMTRAEGVDQSGGGDSGSSASGDYSRDSDRAAAGAATGVAVDHHVQSRGGPRVEVSDDLTSDAGASDGGADSFG